MTPDERLREAVDRFLHAANGIPFGGTDEQNAALEIAAKALIDARNEAMFAARNRPCINAAVKVRGFWSGVGRGLCIVGDSRFFWWMSGMVLGAGLQGLFQ